MSWRGRVLHGCRTCRTGTKPAWLSWQQPFRGGFCELPSPCMGSPHMALQGGGCRRRVRTQIRPCPSLCPKCAPRDDGRPGCEGQHITLRLLLPDWEGDRPVGPPCSVHDHVSAHLCASPARVPVQLGLFCVPCGAGKALHFQEQASRWERSRAEVCLARGT